MLEGTQFTFLCMTKIHLIRFSTMMFSLKNHTFSASNVFNSKIILKGIQTCQKSLVKNSVTRGDYDMAIFGSIEIIVHLVIEFCKRAVYLV